MPAAGMYECDVQVTVLGGGVGGGVMVQLSPVPRITVLAEGSEQLFEILIPQESVDRAVQSALKVPGKPVLRVRCNSMPLQRAKAPAAALARGSPRSRVRLVRLRKRKRIPP
jgi:hypothetical protein